MIDWTIRLRAQEAERACVPYWDCAVLVVGNDRYPLAPLSWEDMCSIQKPTRAGTVNSDVNPLAGVCGLPMYIAADPDRRRMRVFPTPREDMVLDCSPPWSRGCPAATTEPT